MSVFRVGQRVRIRKDAYPVAESVKHLLGFEAIIIGHGKTFDWLLSLKTSEGRPVGAQSSILEPLTDPSADAFMERIRKLGREPVNSPEKVTV